MKYIKHLITLMVFIIAPTFAAQPDESKIDEISKWMTNYYLNKNPKEVAARLKQMQELGFFEKYPNAMAPVIGFLSAVFIENPSEVDGWVRGATYTGRMGECLNVSLALSGKGQPTREVLRDEASILGAQAYNLMAIDMETSAALDLMWGAFFASGNTVYLDKVMDVLQNKKASVQVIDMTQAAAIWSMTSNMKQHEKVREFVEDQVKNNTKYAEEAKKLIELNKQQKKKS